LSLDGLYTSNGANILKVTQSGATAVYNSVRRPIYRPTYIDGLTENGGPENTGPKQKGDCN